MPYTVHTHEITTVTLSAHARRGLIRDIPHVGWDYYCMSYCTDYLSVLGIRDIPHVGWDYCMSYCTDYLSVLGIRDIPHVGWDYCMSYCTDYLSVLGIGCVHNISCGSGPLRITLYDVAC